MKLQTLVSTMGKTDKELIHKMNLLSDSVIINQCGLESSEVLKFADYEVLWINSGETGLSKSRNLAIDRATSDICLLADDDLVYDENYDRIILEEFSNHPDIDILTFQVEGTDRIFKKYHSRSKRLNYITSLKVASVEIAFRRKRIIEKSVRFNEMFGAGAKHKMGEENIFLYECLKKGLKIKYIPKKIARIHVGDSSWFKGYTEAYFKDLGAAFAEMSDFFSVLLIIQFSFRKYRLYKSSIGCIKALKAMFEGRHRYLSEK